MDEATGRKRGGREGRRLRRSEVKGQAPAFITRAIPFYEILGEEGLVSIETHAETILTEIGVEFRGDAEALRLFEAAGADVDGVRVRFERGLVRSLIATTPARFTQHARNPARSVEIGGPHTVFAPAYGSPFVRDREGGRRYASIEDFRNFVKLAYASPWLHHSGGTICEPVDLPVNKRHLDMVDAHIRCSDKPFIGSVTAPERAEDFDRDVPDRVRRALRRRELRDPRQHQYQLAAGVRWRRCPVRSGPTPAPTSARWWCRSFSAARWGR